MGGLGSGGRNRLSDAQKIEKGTFKGTRSDAVYDAKAQSKVFVGPWLDKIPDPEIPFAEDESGYSVGREKYNSLTRMLLDQNKLTMVLRDRAEGAAHAWEEIARCKKDGKAVPASLFNQYNRALDSLQIAEHAPIITDPEAKKNKFEGAGFANRLSAKRGLRRA